MGLFVALLLAEHMFGGSLATDWYKIISDGFCLVLPHVVSHSLVGFLIQQKTSSAQALF